MLIQLVVRNKHSHLTLDLFSKRVEQPSAYKGIRSFEITTDEINELINQLQDYQEVINHPGDGKHSLTITEVKL